MVAATGAIVILAVSTLADAQTAPAPPPAAAAAAWQTVINPVYGGLLFLRGSLQLPEPLSPTSLHGAFGAGCRVERRRWSIQSLFLWAGMSASVQTASVPIDLNATYFKAIGGVRVAPNLYLEGGIRHIALGITVPVLTFVSLAWQPGFWEPVGSVTFRPQLGRTVRVIAQADVGAGRSHRRMTATALIEWKVKRHFSIGGGYGVLYVRADSTILFVPVHVRQALHGPMVAIGIPF